MKCLSCEKRECDRKFKNRDKCHGKKQGIDCSCSCQISVVEEISCFAISIGAGIIVVAGGIAVTVFTHGLLAAVGGAAIVGTGSSLVINPIQKKITGERVTLVETLKDMALGASIGALTGPIAGISDLARGAPTVAKFGIRAGAGALAGGVSGTMSETARVIKGEEVTVKSFAKAVGISTLSGTVNGASTHAASMVARGIAQEITKVSFEAATTVGEIASMHFIDKIEIGKGGTAISAKHRAPHKLHFHIK